MSHHVASANSDTSWFVGVKVSERGGRKKKKKKKKKKGDVKYFVFICCGPSMIFLYSVLLAS